MSSLIKVLNAFILKFLQYQQFSSMISISLEGRQELLKNIRVSDLLLYFLWEMGLYMNRQIGNLFDWPQVKLYNKGSI